MRVCDIKMNFSAGCTAARSVHFGHFVNGLQIPFFSPHFGAYQSERQSRLQLDFIGRGVIYGGIE